MPSRRPSRRPDRNFYATRSLFSRVLSYTQGLPWIDYGSADEDSGHSGFALRFLDMNNAAHYLAQTDTTKQVALPAAHADYANDLCATFSGTQAYQSNQPNTFWAFTSKGVSCESLRVFTPLAGAGTRVVDVTTSAANQRGHQCYWTSGADVTAYLGKTGSAVVAATSVGVVGQDVATYMMMRFEQAGANQYEFRRKSSLIASGAYASAPDGTGSSGVPLTVGSVTFPAISAGGTMRIKLHAFFPALTSGQRRDVQQLILSKWGIAP